MTESTTTVEDLQDAVDAAVSACESDENWRDRVKAFTKDGAVRDLMVLAGMKIGVEGDSMLVDGVAMDEGTFGAAIEFKLDNVGENEEKRKALLALGAAMKEILRGESIMVKDPAEDSPLETEISPV